MISTKIIEFHITNAALYTRHSSIQIRNYARKAVVDFILQSSLSIKRKVLEPTHIQTLRMGPDERTFHPFVRLPKEIRDHIWKYTLPGPRIIKVQTPQLLWPVHARVCDPNDPDTVYPFSYGPVFEYHRVWNKRQGDATKDRQILGFDMPSGKPVARLDTSGRTTQRGSKPPSILHVCHESRSWALPAFDYCFSIVPHATVRFTRWDDFPDETLPAGEIEYTPNGEMASPGVRFQPLRDTLYVPHGHMISLIFDRKFASELCTHNIQSMALPLELFDEHYRDMNSEERMIDKEFFHNLKELFLLFEAESPWSSDSGHSLAVDATKDRGSVVKRVKEQLISDCGFDTHLTVEVMERSEFNALDRWGGHTGFEHNDGN